MSKTDEIVKSIKDNDLRYFKTNKLTNLEINSATVYNNFKEVPVIYYALLNGQLEIAELLIDQCTSLRDVNTLLYLMEATRNKDCSLDLLKKLLKLGCDINESNDGFTPIFNLAFHGNVEKISYFIDHGADLSRVNKWKVNIISNAVFSPTFNLDALILLVEKGADYMTIDTDGESFVDSARSAHMPQELINIFERAFNGEISRSEFVDELKKAKTSAPKADTNFAGEKRKLEYRRNSVTRVKIPRNPERVDQPELSRIYVDAMQGRVKEALIAATVMMDNMKISVMLLFIMAAGFKEIGEMELFEEYRKFFLYACRGLGQAQEFGVMMIENRLGKDALYKLSAFKILFENVL